MTISWINPFLSNYVSAIDSILIGTNYRKQYHISVLGASSNSQGFNYVALIEGIGSTFGLTYQLGPPFEAGSTLDCFAQNNITLYPNTTTNCNLNIGIKTINTQNSTFQIYPNPSNGVFNLTISQFDNLKTIHIEIYNSVGECVHRQIATSSNCQIDLSNLSQGVYNLSLSNTTGVVNKRLVIVH